MTEFPKTKFEEKSIMVWALDGVKNRKSQRKKTEWLNDMCYEFGVKGGTNEQNPSRSQNQKSENLTATNS